MERDRYPGFPGFRMYHEFFAGLGGAFETVICTEDEKRRLLCEIRGLVGHPAHEFRLLREDLELTAKIREARRYDANRLFVRFEFRRMEPNCTWSRPLQMMALFDEHLQLASYTVLRDRDAVGEELKYRMTRKKYNWDGPIEDSYRIRVKPGTERQMQARLFNKTLEDGMSIGEMNKLLAYLAIRGQALSMNNLGYQFHFGKGVAKNYDLAEYWHLKGAAAGNVYCMLSLGKIYSEKTGPKWNGPKAIKWFEKAAAHGDFWAKGELGHCILCGKCVTRDFARAEALLTEAVEACPDRKDFAADLERARNGENL